MSDATPASTPAGTPAATPDGTPDGTWAPRPGAARPWPMVRSQAGLELRILWRNGEQLLLTLVIPVILLVALSSFGVLDLGAGPRVDVVLPGVLALAVMSTAFTGQAISTGFERRYGALKLLGTTPLPRWGLVAAKMLAVLAVEAVQVVVLVGVALALGWRPGGAPLAVLVLLLAGTAAFASWGLVLAGLLRAEATLAVANGIYLLLLLGGGIVVPLDRMPDALAAVASLLPSGALAGGLRAVMTAGEALPWTAVGLLVAWAVAGVAVASRTFRWE